ncbi:hypothetical protein ACN47E_000520 [Coniothyrium glycines]
MSQTTRSAKALLSHQERTAKEPRDDGFHTAIVSKILPVNDRIKRFQFEIKDPSGFKFLAGQWLDVFVPNVEKAGGFTITSSPNEALPQSDPEHKPYFELAIQKSPTNPTASWLWQPEGEIQGKEITVRVGGSFVWPPRLDVKEIKRVIFVAGGVGINPVMSMLSYINQEHADLETRLLYSTKVPSRETNPTEVLFLNDMLELFRIPRSASTKDRIELFYTGTWDGSDMGTRSDALIHPLMSLTLPQMCSDSEVPVTAWTHRIDDSALRSAVGSEKAARSTVFYVCGPPDMSDSIVKFITEQPAVVEEHVLCEKWW